MAYELIETIEVGAGGASSIEFTSIPQDGVDLLVVFSIRSTGTTNFARLRFNSDTSNNYSIIFLEGNGSTASSTSPGATTSSFPLTIGISSQTSNTFGNAMAYISNYTSADDKSVSADVVNENNATAATAEIAAGKYATSSAITALSFTSVDTFVQYSTASLYKIY